MVEEISIRGMKIGDLKRVMEIERSSFPSPWSRRAYYNELTANPYAYYYVALKKEQIVSYLGSWLMLTDAHITTLAVDSSFRRKGLARIFLTVYLERVYLAGVKRITLEVRDSNRVAINLYSSMGFVHIGVRSNYYRDNKEDALLFGLEIG